MGWKDPEDPLSVLVDCVDPMIEEVLMEETNPNQSPACPPTDKREAAPSAHGLEADRLGPAPDVNHEMEFLGKVTLETICTLVSQAIREKAQPKAMGVTTG